MKKLLLIAVLLLAGCSDTGSEQALIRTDNRLAEARQKRDCFDTCIRHGEDCYVCWDDCYEEIMCQRTDQR